MSDNVYSVKGGRTRLIEKPKKDTTDENESQINGSIGHCLIQRIEIYEIHTPIHKEGESPYTHVQFLVEARDEEDVVFGCRGANWFELLGDAMAYASGVLVRLSSEMHQQRRLDFSLSQHPLFDDPPPVGADFLTDE